MSELVTTKGAVAIVFPIAMASAMGLGVDPRPYAITIGVAAASSFATPIGYQTNLMVYGPGGYRFFRFFESRSAVEVAGYGYYRTGSTDSLAFLIRLCLRGSLVFKQYAESIGSTRIVVMFIIRSDDGL